MSTNKQALREKFEAWAEEAGALPWGHLKKQRTASGNYSVQIYTYMWKAWSACHEALLDELEAAQIYAKDRDEENQDLMLTVGRLRVEREASEAELGNALCELLPGVQYMDPPDGGSPSIIEQVRRMVADYREQIQAAENRNAEQASIIAKQEKWIKDVEVTMISATDRAEAAEKRIDELSESHSKLRETMAAIHNTIKQDGFATPLAVIMQNAKRAHEESAAAGITVKGDSE